jgi:hypothetical protein
MATLKVITGPGAGQTVRIGADAIIIGRENADLTIPDPELSRRHAAVSRSGAHVVVQDLGSTNGVFVDGLRIEKPARLDHGATLRVGTSEIALELEPAVGLAPQPAPVEPPDAPAEAVQASGTPPERPRRASARRGPPSRRRLGLVVAAVLVPVAVAAAAGIALLVGEDGAETRTLDARLTALPLAEPTSAQAAGILEGEPLGRVAVIFQRRLDGTPRPGGPSVPLLGSMLVLSSDGSLVLNLRGDLALRRDGGERVRAEGIAANGTGDFEGVSGSVTLTGGRDDPRSPYGRFDLDGTLEY